MEDIGSKAAEIKDDSAARLTEACEAKSELVEVGSVKFWLEAEVATRTRVNIARCISNGLRGFKAADL